MPIVTAIKRQARSGSNRFNISIDGSYAFSLPDLDLSMSGLRVGMELTESEVERFSHSAHEAKAYALALRYVGLRLRSRRELSDYLLRKGHSAQEAEAALERLAELGLVDDARFAQAWIADRMAIRPRSRLRLSQELAQKGVARDIIDVALQELDPDTEIAKLKAIIERKMSSSGYQDEQKLLGYLQRQGYRWSLIQEAVRQIKEAD